MKKKIYYIRHAETEAIVNDILAGRELETLLTENGKQQAKEAGQFLKDKGIELIVVSPMERTRQTAAIIAKELGLDASKLIENELIIERAYGTYSGKSFKEFKQAAAAGRLDKSQLETSEELFARVAKAFEWLSARPEQTILVVSHGATGRMFRVVDQKLSHADFHKVKNFANAEIDEFTI